MPMRSPSDQYSPSTYAIGVSSLGAHVAALVDDVLVVLHGDDLGQVEVVRAEQHLVLDHALDVDGALLDERRVDAARRRGSEAELLELVVLGPRPHAGQVDLDQLVGARHVDDELARRVDEPARVPRRPDGDAQHRRVRAHRADPRERDDVGLLLAVAGDAQQHDRGRQQRRGRLALDLHLQPPVVRPQSYSTQENRTVSGALWTRFVQWRGRREPHAQTDARQDGHRHHRPPAERRAARLHRHRQRPRHLRGQRAPAGGAAPAHQRHPDRRREQPARPRPHVGADPPAGQGRPHRGRGPGGRRPARRWTT